MPHFFKTKTFFLLFIIVIICGIFFSLKISQKKIEVPGRLSPVTKGNILQKITTIGAITAKQSTIITAPYSGNIKEMLVHIGDTVKTAQPLTVFVPITTATNTTVYPIRSSAVGVVVQSGQNGDYVDVGKPIIRIDDLSELYISVSIPEIDYIRLKKGQEVWITPTATPSIVYQGEVVTFALAASAQEGWNESAFNSKFFARIRILKIDPSLHPGMSATVNIVTAKKTDVPILSHEFIYTEKEKKFVTLKSGEKREIKTGLENEEGVEIVSGLALGDEVKQVDFSLFGEEK